MVIVTLHKKMGLYKNILSSHHRMTDAKPTTLQQKFAHFASKRVRNPNPSSTHKFDTHLKHAPDHAYVTHLKGVLEYAVELRDLGMFGSWWRCCSEAFFATDEYAGAAYGPVRGGGFLPPLRNRSRYNTARMVVHELLKIRKYARARDYSALQDVINAVLAKEDSFAKGWTDTLPQPSETASNEEKKLIETIVQFVRSAMGSWLYMQPKKLQSALKNIFKPHVPTDLPKNVSDNMKIYVLMMEAVNANASTSRANPDRHRFVEGRKRWLNVANGNEAEFNWIDTEKKEWFEDEALRCVYVLLGSRHVYHHHGDLRSPMELMNRNITASGIAGKLLLRILADIFLLGMWTRWHYEDEQRDVDALYRPAKYPDKQGKIEDRGFARKLGVGLAFHVLNLVTFGISDAARAESRMYKLRRLGSSHRVKDRKT
jgi:hypothetical protein